MIENGKAQIGLQQHNIQLKSEAAKKLELVREWVGGEVYEYYPLGEHVVAAPGVCGGRPTFKYTRVEAKGALNLIAVGYSLEQIAQRFEVPLKAVEEALRVAAVYMDNWKVAA